MFLARLERFEYLSGKAKDKSLLPDEREEIDTLRHQVMEWAGINDSSSGFVVISNYRLVFQEYKSLVETAQIEPSPQLEEKIYWSALEEVELHVSKNANKNLLSFDSGMFYYKAVSAYLRSNRIPESSQPGWKLEPISGKWGILRGKIKQRVSKILENHIKDCKPTVGLKIEDRLEPVFNKALKQLNKEIDANGLTTQDVMKLVEKLGTTLAGMKGELKQEQTAAPTHNNVFIAIMDSKGDKKQLQDKAIDLLEGDGYALQ